MDPSSQNDFRQNRIVDPSPPLRAKVDQIAPLNYSPSQAATSTAGSSVGARHVVDYSKNKISTTPKDPIKEQDDSTSTMNTSETGSYLSYHSARDLNRFIKEISGRMFNNQSELYMLPSDDEEFTRLAKQHYCLLISLNDLYPEPEVVEEILLPEDRSRRPAILDLGCGSGIWAIEMAHRFPHCEVVGIDLAPAPVDLENIPPNLRFEIDDMNLGLDHYHDYYDLIHIRCVGSGIHNYASMMQDAENCLRPGGMIIFMDGDMKMYSEDYVNVVPLGQEESEGGDPSKGSWLYRLMREMRWAGAYNGADIDGLEDDIDRGLWGHPLIDPETVRVASLFAPIGPWATSNNTEKNKKLEYAGSLLRQDLTRVNHAFHALLTKHGLSQDVLNVWSARADKEMAKLKFHMSFRWRLTWGRRLPPAPSDTAADASTTAPPPATNTTTAPTATNTTFEDPTPTTSTQAVVGTTPETGSYQNLFVYYTQEEALRAMEMRKDAVKDLPVPLVTTLREESRRAASSAQ